jgi:hypothetical protein
VERERHAVVPKLHVEQDHQLGAWVQSQRSKRKSLDTGQTRQLNDIGFVWNANEYAWEAAFAELTRYVERDGHALVPQVHIEGGVTLGRWVTKQRQKYASGSLSTNKAHRLESLEGWAWNTLEAAWEEGYSHLNEFMRREGHARVPPKYVDPDGYLLGGWVGRQRAAYKNQKLDLQRIHRLNAIEGWAWDQNEADWEAMRILLDRFRKREGHTLVPYTHTENEVNLGSWVSAQRSSHRRSKLPVSRVSQLETIPGWTWKARNDT